ncbi:MAG: response regulator [Ardenticatenaceae bacterium]|nr:response regulator [Ardenticatenaceae bacterium]
MRFLIVDDEKQNLYMLQALLRGHGFAVETAVNGREALQKAKTNPPNLIISDILMPVMDGFSLCRAWMQDEQLQAIPFIFYTATYTDPKDEAFALELGAARFILKPAEPEELVAIINEVLAEVGNGRVRQPTAQDKDEPIFLKNYNERLIQKLEDKMSQLEQANRHLKVLYWASSNLSVVMPLRELVFHSLQTVVEALGYAYANYFVFDEQSQQFLLLEAVGYTKETFTLLQKELIFKLGEERGLVGLVGQTHEPLIIPETAKDPRWLAVDKTVRSALFVPVIYEDDLLGVACFFTTEPNAFNQDHVRDVSTLANNIAVAIKNAQLYEAQQRYAERLEAEVATRTAELQIAMERAQAADKLKSQLVSNINHELRTPLTVIKLYLGLLARGRTQNWEQYVNILNRETDRLQMMVEDVLDVSSLDLGQKVANLAPADLNLLISNLLIDRGELAAKKGLTLDFAPAQDIPFVMADEQLLFQVLTNLLANSINYTATGGITISTGTAVSDDEMWITASVTDTGPGVSEEEKVHLFERFYRGKASQEGNIPGTGLGLAICREIMERHRGRISIESVENAGSTFTIWLRPAS